MGTRHLYWILTSPSFAVYEYEYYYRGDLQKSGRTVPLKALIYTQFFILEYHMTWSLPPTWGGLSDYGNV